MIMEESPYKVVGKPTNIIDMPLDYGWDMTI